MESGRIRRFSRRNRKCHRASTRAGGAVSWRNAVGVLRRKEARSNGAEKRSLKFARNDAEISHPTFSLSCVAHRIATASHALHDHDHAVLDVEIVRLSNQKVQCNQSSSCLCTSLHALRMTGNDRSRPLKSIVVSFERSRPFVHFEGFSRESTTPSEYRLSSPRNAPISHKRPPFIFPNSPRYSCNRSPLLHAIIKRQSSPPESFSPYSPAPVPPAP